MAHAVCKATLCRQRGRCAGIAPVWINILRGDMALVGPRPLTAAEADEVPTGHLERFAVRPGLILSLGVRARESASPMRRSRSWTGSWPIASRFARPRADRPGGGLQCPRRRRRAPAPPLIGFFGGIPVVNTSMDEAIHWCVEQARAPIPGLLAFVHPDCLNIALGHRAYRQSLTRIRPVLPDGIGPAPPGCRMMG